MKLFQDIPYASERMGILWTLGTVTDAYILEFGPEGSTHYAAVQHGTYNADMKADLYTTGLTEKEVIFGDTGLLIQAARELIERHRPSHLFILPSAVSEITGVDIDSVCRALSRQSTTQVINIGGISLDSCYTNGIERILAMLAEKAVRQPDRVSPKTYNLIGSNMDCFNYLSDIKEVERLLAGAFQLSLKTIFTGGTSMEKLVSAGEAAFNIVLRKEGLSCARILQERFGQPYFYGIPYGIEGTRSWIKSVAEMICIRPDQTFLEREITLSQEFIERMNYYKRASQKIKPSFVICGSYDLLKNLAPFMENELDFEIKALILTHMLPEDAKEGLLYFKTDTEKYAFITSIAPDYLLSDAITLRHFQTSIPGLQIANPNLCRERRFAYTPFMGFRGAQVISQDISNLILQT